jgi:hypothetical protein
MNSLKETFYKVQGGVGDVGLRQEAIGKLFGISKERIVKIWGGAELTVAEFNKFGRAPAAQVPMEIWYAEKLSVINEFSNFNPTVECETGNFEDAARDNWLGMEENKVLASPARIMKPFIRVRPRRLMQSLQQNALLTERVRLFASKCYRPNFTTVRFVATIIYWLSVDDFAKRELEYLLDIGGYRMNSVQWATFVKRHHALVKVKHRCLTTDELLTVVRVSSMIYLQNLACRDQYMTQEQFDDEVVNRQRIPEDYSTESKDRLAFEFEFRELMRNELLATGQLRGPTSWDDFTESAYLKLPGGSTSLIEQVTLSDCAEVIGVDGLRGVRLSGNKRLRAEVDPIMDFISLGAWVVYAFLKYEVGKVRYLYPANFGYTVLGLYIMDHMYGAFQAISGIDMGHNIFGSVAVKLDVLFMVASGYCGANCDGKGFNENHSHNDMRLVYDCCREASASSDSRSYQQLNAAINHYVGSLEKRSVVLSKIGPVQESKRFDVGHTLFSGEATTQLVNTMLLFGLSVIGVRSAVRQGRVGEFYLFLKGDDLNGFCLHWLEGVAAFHHVGFLGMLLEPAKDHVEPYHSEHERCLVSPAGYNGSIARRIGAAVAAEPQGSRGLTLAETLQTMAEHHQSMICRGSSPEVVEMFSKAMLMTCMNVDCLPKGMWAATKRPKITGGFGLWRGEFDYYRKASQMPRVTTRLRLRRDGKFGKMGSAHMTDPIIRKLARDHNFDAECLQTERDEMVCDTIESGLGPEKYGDRRVKNVARVADFVANLSAEHDRWLRLSSGSQAVATVIAEEFLQLLMEPKEFRYFSACTPRQVIDRQLSKSGCINADIYKRLHGIERGDNVAYLKSLIKTVQRGAEGSVVSGLSEIPFSEAALFYNDVFDVTFWRIDERINTETSALVRSYVLQKVAESSQSWSLETNRQLNVQIKWEYVLTGVAEVVWERSKHKLSQISF